MVVANTAFSWGESVSYAFLPELAKPEAMGKVSGWGWGLGYAGGMLTLGICLVWVMSAQARGETAADFVPITMLITAVMYGAASLFTFALLKERTLPTKSTDDVASAVMAVPERTLQGFQASMRRLHETWQASARYRDFSLLLGSAVFYQGGVAVAITLAAIYAQQVIGFQPQEIMVLVFVINAAAMIGALVFGHLQDKMGHRLTLSLTLVGWTITCILAGLATTKLAFWYAAALAGVCMGSSQSCGRAMAGLSGAHQATGRVLWAVVVCHPIGCDCGAPNVRPDHVGNRGRSTHGDFQHGTVVRGGLGVFDTPRHGAWPASGSGRLSPRPCRSSRDLSFKPRPRVSF